MIECLREIRDKISFNIQDMNFEEMQEYFTRDSKINKTFVWKDKYKVKAKTLNLAESRAKYGKK